MSKRNKHSATFKAQVALQAYKGESVFAMAGIREVWEDKSSGEIIASCAILTTQAKGVVSDIHDRMPVILDRTGCNMWLDPKMQAQKRS